MDFVVDVLETLFQKSPAEAYRIMMQVHVSGRGVAGIYPWEVAETKVDAVLSRARERRAPAAGDHRGRVSCRDTVCSHMRLKSCSPSRSARRSRASTPTSRSSTCYTRSLHDPDGERILAACGADLPALAQGARDVSRRVCRAAQTRRRARTRADHGLPPGPADGRHARPERASATKRTPATCSPRSSSSRRATRRSCSPARASRGWTS